MGASKQVVGGIGPIRSRTSKDNLTDAAVKAARPRKAAFKLSDGQSLYLLVQSSGSKLWRLKYRHGGAERVYAIGIYPEVTLAAARTERDRAREWIRAGKDPTIERRTVQID